MAQSLERYAAEYARTRSAAGTGASSWVERLRDDALTRFLSLGFPTTREEEWRFTSVEPISARSFEVAAPGSAPAIEGREGLQRAIGRGVELVFVDGHYVPTLSTANDLPAGAFFGSLASAIATGDPVVQSHLARIAAFADQPFVALNTAFLDDGAFLSVPAGAVLERPLHLLFYSTGTRASHATMTHPRVLVVLGTHSQASLVESYVGVNGAEYLTNAVTEVVLGESSVFHHYKVQRESLRSHHIGAMHLRAARNAACVCHSAGRGGLLVRNDVSAVLEGEGADCALHGLYVADGERLVDNHTTIDHATPHGTSREIYKGILAGASRGVFNGKIIVRRDAQKTDAKQTNRALLLSDAARINTKPQLEIFANDVKCTHGAAVGQLDEEAVFYLRARGLSEPDARRLLVYAFAEEVLQYMPSAHVRAAVSQALAQQFERILPAAGRPGEESTGRGID